MREVTHTQQEGGRRMFVIECEWMGHNGWLSYDGRRYDFTDSLDRASRFLDRTDALYVQRYRRHLVNPYCTDLTMVEMVDPKKN